MECLAGINDGQIMVREEAKEMCMVYRNIMVSLEEYMSSKIEEWGRDVEATSQVSTQYYLTAVECERREWNANANVNVNM